MDNDSDGGEEQLKKDIILEKVEKDPECLVMEIIGYEHAFWRGRE